MPHSIAFLIIFEYIESAGYVIYENNCRIRLPVEVETWTKLNLLLPLKSPSGRDGCALPPNFFIGFYNTCGFFCHRELREPMKKGAVSDALIRSFPSLIFSPLTLKNTIQKALGQNPGI